MWPPENLFRCTVVVLVPDGRDERLPIHITDKLMYVGMFMHARTHCQGCFIVAFHQTNHRFCLDVNLCRTTFLAWRVHTFETALVRGVNDSERKYTCAEVSFAKDANLSLFHCCLFAKCSMLDIAEVIEQRSSVRLIKSHVPCPPPSCPAKTKIRTPTCTTPIAN